MRGWDETYFCDQLEQLTDAIHLPEDELQRRILAASAPFGSGIFQVISFQRKNMAVVDSFVTENFSAMQTYVDDYAAMDPRLPRASRAPSGVWHTASIFTEQELKSSPLFNEFLRDNDADVQMGTISQTHPDVVFVTALMRKSRIGEYDESLTPSLVRLGKTLETVFALRGEGLDTQSLENVYDTRAVFLDAAARVVFIGDRAERYIKNSFIMIKNNRLAPHLAIDQSKLDAALDRLLRRSALAGDNVSIPMRSEYGEILGSITCYRLSQTGKFDPLGSSPRVAVILRPVGIEMVDVRALMEAFDLTPSEAALCKALLRGDDIAKHAQNRQITVATVRGTLKAVFAKTQTNRQPALVKLLTQTFEC